MVKTEVEGDQGEPRSRKLHTFMGMFLASMLSAVFFWPFYIWLLQPLPANPIFWDGAVKFGYVWVLNIVITVVVHLMISAVSAYDYQITNWFQFSFQTISSVFYTLFVMFGVYGWFLAVIPITVGFDQYPWFFLLIAFGFLKLVTFSITYPLAITFAHRMDDSGRRVGDSVTRFSHRAAWGREHRDRKSNERRDLAKLKAKRGN